MRTLFHTFLVLVLTVSPLSTTLVAQNNDDVVNLINLGTTPVSDFIVVTGDQHGGTYVTAGAQYVTTSHSVNLAVINNTLYSNILDAEHTNKNSAVEAIYVDNTYVAFTGGVNIGPGTDWQIRFIVYNKTDLTNPVIKVTFRDLVSGAQLYSITRHGDNWYMTIGGIASNSYAENGYTNSSLGVTGTPAGDFTGTGTVILMYSQTTGMMEQQAYPPVCTCHIFQDGLELNPSGTTLYSLTMVDQTNVQITSYNSTTLAQITTSGNISSSYEPNPVNRNRMLITDVNQDGFNEIYLMSEFFDSNNNYEKGLRRFDENLQEDVSFKDSLGRAYMYEAIQSQDLVIAGEYMVQLFNANNYYTAQDAASVTFFDKDTGQFEMSQGFFLENANGDLSGGISVYSMEYNQQNNELIFNGRYSTDQNGMSFQGIPLPNLNGESASIEFSLPVGQYNPEAEITLSVPSDPSAVITLDGRTFTVQTNANLANLELVASLVYPNSDSYLFPSSSLIIDATDGNIDYVEAARYRGGSIFDFSAVFEIKAGTLGVGEFEKEQLTLYPNPTHGILQVPEKFQNLKGAVYDLTGRKIMDISQAGTSLNLSSQSPGLYIVRLRNDSGGVFHQKIILR